VLGTGTQAPDFELESSDGTSVRLSDLHQEGWHTLLVFLRYLG
jgi:peroxiredoxin